MLAGAFYVDSSGPVRCREAGGDREMRGWYWLATKELPNPDTGQLDRYITGACGVYRGNDNGKIAIKVNRDGRAVKISKEDLAAIAARQKANMARLKAMREAEANRAALLAGNAWRKYLADGECDYLARKGVGAHGVRFSPSGNNTMAIPMMDPGGKIWGLQVIRGKDRAKGKLEKEYWPKGLAKQGHYHTIGGVPRGVVLLAEGYATAATLHQATGMVTLVAFDAGNLTPVAQAIKKAYRDVRILVCADDDYKSDGNPGVTAAKNAAHAVEGGVCVPQFAEARPQDRKGPTDFNDLAALEGESTVRAQVEATLRELGWDALPVSRAGIATLGGGESDGIPSVIQIDEAQDRFTMVYGSGGTWFDTKEHMLVPKSDVQDILPEHGMRDMRTRKRVVRMDEVGFDPAGSDARIKCNLWGGWPTTSAQGSCEILLELLRYLCSGEQNSRAIFDWVLKWLAYPIQHPGAKMRTALIIHGPQGAGKNLFFETVMAIYGEYGRIVDQAAIEDKFNDWASRKLFLIADEVVARAELFHIKNKLKSLITGEWIRINPKNVAAHDERNHVNLVFLSNERQPLVLEKDDRRFAVIWTPDKLLEGFYADVRAELNAGGREALHHFLLNLDLGDFNEHTKPPMTEAKREVIDISMGSVERFLADWQQGQVVLGNDSPPLPFCPCASGDLYGAYTRYCKAEGVARPRESNQFIGHIAKLPGWEKALKDRYETLNSNTAVRQRFIIPSNAALNKAAEIGLKDFRKDSHFTQTEWLTECFFTFRKAIGGLE